MTSKWEFLRVAFYLSHIFIVKMNSITSCIRNGVDKSHIVDDFGVSNRSIHMQVIPAGTGCTIYVHCKFSLGSHLTMYNVHTAYI